MSFRGRNALILGLGKSGLSSALLLRHLGASVFVSELKNEKDIPSAYLSQLKKEGIPFEAGNNSLSSLDQKDLLIISPGVPADTPILQEAAKKNLEIISEVELAYRLTSVPIIAITGTNGKTTTTTLVAELLKASGKKVLLGGNIGTPLTQLCLEKGDYLVAEISSFQMEYSPTFRPHIALFLNFTDDHIYRHGSRENYFSQKLRLFQNQTSRDYAILNSDDPWVNGVAEKISSQAVFFSRQKKIPVGAFVEDSMIKLCLNGNTQDILPQKELFIKGSHNIENGLAALCAAALCNVSPQMIRKVLKEFRGVTHRLEWVANIHGIDYYNDSKGTNYDSTIKAIEAFDRPIHLILGGVDKGGDMTTLLELIRNKVSHVLLIGQSSPLYAERLKAVGFKNVILAEDMAGALRNARVVAKSGEIVLLSPACASFDQYNNYEERGNHFKSLVNDVK